MFNVLCPGQILEHRFADLIGKVGDELIEISSGRKIGKGVSEDEFNIFGKIIKEKRQASIDLDGNYLLDFLRDRSSQYPRSGADFSDNIFFLQFCGLEDCLKDSLIDTEMLIFKDIRGEVLFL